ncbi:MAG: phosphoethanolamine transferase domain-containing protein, partial [Sulfuricurvum sp.]
MFKSFNTPRSSTFMVLAVALILVLFENGAFFKHVVEIYPMTSTMNTLFVASLGIVLMGVTTIVLSLLSWRYTLKPLLIVILIVSSLIAYFMDSYDIVVDTHMIQNALETNLNESSDLFSLKLMVYFILLGIIPSILVYRVKIEQTT